MYGRATFAQKLSRIVERLTMPRKGYECVCMTDRCVPLHMRQ